MVRAFNASYSNEGSTVKVVHWAVCREPHKNGAFHYHCCLSLSNIKKWKSPWKHMYSNGVTVNISDAHDYYISMFQYVMKADTDAYCSPGHPDLRTIGSPRTKACNKANRKRHAAKNAASSSASKKSAKVDDAGAQQWNRKLTPLDVGDYVIKKNISCKKQLYAEAAKRKEQGECDLAAFMFSKTEKYLAELIFKAWTMKNAEKELSDDSKSRMTRLEEAQNGQCVITDCRWLECAMEVLNNNKIDHKAFGAAVLQSLRYGRQKFRNIMIVGPSNTGKSFLLKPLQAIFGEKLFENPSMDKYGWSGVENCQAVFLNDFRYCKELIPWGVFLLFLEGETVNLPTPKNHFADDIRINRQNDLPIFATAGGKIEFSKFSPNYVLETEMMDSRWNFFHFTHIIPRRDQKIMEPCGRCFAQLITS